MELLRRITLEHIEEIEKSEKPDQSKVKKYYLILELLKDDQCFFKISKEDAYQILCHLGIVNPVKYYKKLISPTNYLKVEEMHSNT